MLLLSSLRKAYSCKRGTSSLEKWFGGSRVRYPADEPVGQSDSNTGLDNPFVTGKLEEMWRGGGVKNEIIKKNLVVV